VKEASAILQLQDLDLLLAELGNSKSPSRLKKLGYPAIEPAVLERARAKLLTGIDRRWMNHYERAAKRFGRAVAVVRERVCQGCFITLPTSASPGTEERLTLCEQCGRILYWR
jgi:hypothetical protein